MTPTDNITDSKDTDTPEPDVDVEAPADNTEEEVLPGETIAVDCLKGDNDKIMEDNGKITEDNGKITEDNGKITEDNGKITKDNDTITEDNGRITDAKDANDVIKLEQKQGEQKASRNNSANLVISPMKSSSTNEKHEEVTASPSVSGVDAAKMEVGVASPQPTMHDILGSMPAPLPLARHSGVAFPNQTPGAYHVTGFLSRDVTSQTLSGPVAVQQETSSPPEEMAAFNAELVCDDEADENINPTETASTSTGEHQQEDLPPVVLGTTVLHNDYHKEEEDSKRFWWLSLAGILVLVAVVVFLSLGLSGVFDGNPQNEMMEVDEPIMEVSNTDVSNSGLDSGPDAEPLQPARRSTLDIVRERKVLRAGFDSYVSMLDFENYNGFLPTLTRSIGAGLMGPEGELEFVRTPIPEIFQSLLNGTIDIILFGATHTMDRDVFMESTQDTVSFSIPYNYEGLRIGGDPFYVSCIDDDFHHLGECEDLQICVTAGTIFRDIFLAERLPRKNIVEVLWEEGGVWEGLISGKCNLIAESSALLQKENIQDRNGTFFEGDYALSRNYFTHSPEAVVTRPNDAKFVDAINAVLWSLMAAEQQNITQDTAQHFPQTTLFGDEYKDMFRDAIAFNGNMEQIYDGHTQMWRKDRHELVRINNGSTGLLYSHPFGSLATVRNNKPLGPTLEAILQRGKLHCGIPTNRPGFSSKLEDSFVGMDVDYCRALSASLFGGNTQAVEFVELEDDSDGYALLASGEIDVLAGATWTLENDVKEPTTGEGYTFSQPYFYGFSNERDNLALATKQDNENEDWSRFVFWVVTASFFAEEEGIDSLSSIDMPEVFVFGRDLKRMFRDPIFGIGNYGEMYERNLAGLYPREGRNHLNKAPHMGPQHYLIPGFF